MDQQVLPPPTPPPPDGSLPPSEPFRAPTQAPPQKRKVSRRSKIGLGAAGIVILVIIAGVTGSAMSKNSPTPATSPSLSPNAAAAAQPTFSAPPPSPVIISPPAPFFATPTKSDFHLSLKTVSKQCFGDIGCNWMFKVKLATASIISLDPDKTYDVTYKITGDESGPIIGTTEVTGDQYTVQEEDVSTSQNGVVPKIEIVSVEEA